MSKDTKDVNRKNTLLNLFQIFRVVLVRTRMYDLIARCIPSSLIIKVSDRNIKYACVALYLLYSDLATKNLAFDLANKVDRRLRNGVIEHAALYVSSAHWIDYIFIKC